MRAGWVGFSVGKNSQSGSSEVLLWQEISIEISGFRCVGNLKEISNFSSERYFALKYFCLFCTGFKCCFNKPSIL